MKKQIPCDVNCKGKAGHRVLCLKKIEKLGLMEPNAPLYPLPQCLYRKKK